MSSTFLSKKRTKTKRGTRKSKSLEHGNYSKISMRVIMVALPLAFVAIRSYTSSNDTDTTTLLTNLIVTDPQMDADMAIAVHKTKLLEDRAALLELRQETPSMNHPESTRRRESHSSQQILEDQFDARILEKRRKIDERESLKQSNADESRTGDKNTINEIKTDGKADRNGSTDNMDIDRSSNDFRSGADTSIRKWGCARNETPFIFVHIGKAGGGSVRARMAAAALDYNRSGWHRTHEDDHYYYPIYANHNVEEKDGTVLKRFMHKAKFLSSKHSNYIHPDHPEFHGDFAYEGHGPCGAATPIGQAVACPVESTYCIDHDQDVFSEARCDLVYMGHNLLGSELHWLPTKYLVQWWKSTSWGVQGEEANGDALGDMIQNRHIAVSHIKWPVHPKVAEIVGEENVPTLNCNEGPYTYRPFLRAYKQCFQPKEKVVDTVTRHIVRDEDRSSTNESSLHLAYARMMASMPVMRVTVLRDPFSWLSSKFFWIDPHHLGNGTIVISDSGNPGRNKKRKDDWEAKHGAPVPVVKCDDLEAAVAGWASNRAMSYIFYLCGEHCIGGWADGSMTLDDLEKQGAYNLRNSFAVVGLLNKTDDFYKMVSQRVFYMDTSLNPEVDGKKHTIPGTPEVLRCREKFQMKEFQDALLERSPSISALFRLYKVAIEVNEFQARELAECSATSQPFESD